MPDELRSAMMLGGVALALIAAALVRAFREAPVRRRRLAHAAVCVGGLLFGGGLLIEMLREESKLSHGAIAVFAVCVLLTTVSYVVWAVSARRGVGVAATALLLATVLSAMAVGISFDDEECGCGNPAVEVTTG